MKFYGIKHETTAAFMAAAEGKLTGKAGGLAEPNWIRDSSGNPYLPRISGPHIRGNHRKRCLISLDVRDHIVWFNRIFQGIRHEVLLSDHWRSMGFGLPAALSAKLILPDSQVIALTGDGGFAQSMAEFLTAVCYRIPVTVIIVNNGWLWREIKWNSNS